jgi:hypothetical protein
VQGLTLADWWSFQVSTIDGGSTNTRDPGGSCDPAEGRAASEGIFEELTSASVPKISPDPCCSLNKQRTLAQRWFPFYAARIEDLVPGDFVKVDCTCGHTALLAPAFLSRLGLSPRDKVLDLQGRVRCRGCGARGRAVVSIKWARSAA